MKARTILLLTLFFVTLNISIFYLTKQNAQYKIDIVLKDNLKTLTTHYKILLQTQSLTAKGLYKSTRDLKGFIEIIAEANDASVERKAQLRDALRRLLKTKYERAKEKGVLQYHFVLKNNESFYRAHKPSKFGDSLREVRADFAYVNETQKEIRGFTQGKTAHGFRNVFPLFDANGVHVGAMEVSFSSDSFQWYLNKISGIHSHFLVDKHIFDSNAWKRDDLVLKYEQSAESPNYMLTLGKLHKEEKCIVANALRLKRIAQEIEEKIVEGKAFSSYVASKNEVMVVSFLPVKNLEDKALAWIVSYEDSPIIKSSLQNSLVVRAVSFFISLLIIYFLVKLVYSREQLEEKNRGMERQHKLLNDILNATDNVMLITDFRDVKFSNNRFKNMLQLKRSQQFNQKSHHDFLSIFIHKEGYLHSGLLESNESFVSLIARTPPEDRVVAIEDKNIETQAFKISLSKTENSEDYLVTLSDITKMKAHYDETQKKAYVDGLTKVYNRNKFDEALSEELEDVKADGGSFSMAIIDIDKFKDFNDTYGHLIGDEVLITMADAVNKNVRETDVFARWGGEEFVILFKNTSIRRAEVVSNKLRDKIQNNVHPVAGGITASFGLTQYLYGDTPESVFKRCDEALYLAKANGRNRVEVL